MAGKIRRQPVIQTKRVYLPPSSSDGVRILVDRLWPRGLSKDAAGVDRWLKEIAPTDDLRSWFGHHVARWDAFRQRYLDQLEKNEFAVREIVELIEKKGRVTLLFATKDAVRNNATVVREFLVNRFLIMEARRRI